MDRDLEDFLRPKAPKDSIKISGSLACQECNEIVHDGWMKESDMIITYFCSKGHESRVKL